MKSTAHTSTIEREILTSAYKQEIRRNALELRANTLSQIKSKINFGHDKFVSQTGTLLKVSFFSLILAFVLF